MSLGAMAQLPVYLDDTKPLDDRVEDALNRMTPEEKSVLLQGMSSTVKPGVPRLGIPSFNVDTQRDPLFPSCSFLASAWDPELAWQYGHALAERALYRNVHMIGNIDIAETGSDPYLALKMVSPFIEGVHSCGMAVAQDEWFEALDQPASESVDDRLSPLLQLYCLTSMNRQRPMGFLGTDEQKAVARTIAEEGIVLLKNDHGLLPLSAGASCKIWMVGAHPVEGLEEALSRRHIQADWAACTFDQVVIKAGLADVVILTDDFSDRDEIPFLKKVSALIQAGEMGEEGAEALAAVLTGEVNPSGKLPYEWKGIEEKEPLFALGYGLSYTSFELTNMVQSGRELPIGGDLFVTVTVTNTGDREGSEVVQLYIHDIKTSLPKPDKTLQGFRKVTLKPGESQEVSFPINESSVLFYDEVSESWIAEPGFYVAYVGNAMNNTPLKARFHLK